MPTFIALVVILGSQPPAGSVSNPPPSSKPVEAASEERRGARDSGVVDGEGRSSFDAWARKRNETLLAETGWLALEAIVPLQRGTCRAGSDRDNQCVLPPSAPAVLGEFRTDASGTSFTPAPGAAAELAGNRFEGGRLRSIFDGTPDVLHVGKLRLMVTPAPRGTFALRVYNLESAARQAFDDVPRFPFDPAFRVTGTFDKSKGVATVCLGGRRVHLQGYVDEGEVLFIFGDRTNKTQTFQGGRFLSVAVPSDGRITLDFNRAENPPCVFTKAVQGCPPPPPGNRLPLRIAAGERRLH